MNINDAIQKLTASSKITVDLQERPTLLTDQQHTEIVERVTRMFQASIRAQADAPAEFQPGGEWADYNLERKPFYDCLLNGQMDVANAKLRNFWRNELGPIVKEYARFEQLQTDEPGKAERFQNGVLRNYVIWDEIFDQRPNVLQVPAVGNPWGILINEELVAPKATRFHALASQIHDLTSTESHPIVAEIGAGYGGAAYYYLRDHPTTTYVDFDLPETLVIAAYYMLCSFPNRNILLYGEGDLPTAEGLTAYSAVLMPNFAIPQLQDHSVDLFLNSFSFSEMPFETLNAYMTHVHRVVKKYFLHNNMDRQGVINRGFERIPASKYPIDNTMLHRIYKRFDLFHGAEGDYREFLYERVAA